MSNSKLTFSANVTYVDGKIDKWENMELKIGEQTIYPLNSPTVPTSSPAASKNTDSADSSSTALVNASSTAPVDTSSTAPVDASSTALVNASSRALVDTSSRALVDTSSDLQNNYQQLSREEKQEVGQLQTKQIMDKNEEDIKNKQDNSKRATGKIEEIDGGSKRRKSKRHSHKKNKRRNTKRQQYR